jgi:F-type H+-transporting ATPase subunit b
MEELGVNPVLIVAQIVSFLILFAVFKKFLFKFIQKSLEQRRANIKDIYTGKQETEKRLAALELEQEEKRKEMKEMTKKIETEAKKVALGIRQEILAKAHEDAEREVIKAKDRITQEIEIAKRDLGNQAKELAMTMATKILKENINVSDSINKIKNESK